MKYEVEVDRERERVERKGGRERENLLVCSETVTHTQTHKCTMKQNDEEMRKRNE